MTTVLSKKGQIVLPAEVRKQLGLAAGDDFEILVEDDQTIVLRRITRAPNKGLVDLLLECPHPFDVPERERDESDAVAPIGE
jgi:AbrB family looped-hinge helix DNA binding protein